MLRAVIFVAGILAVVALARADVLELKDGRVLNGKYVGGTAGMIRFQTNEGVQVVETAQAIAVTFTAGPTTAPAAVPVATPAPAVTPVAAPVQPAATKRITVPAGTTLLVRMMDSISSQNKPGTRFTTTLDSDLTVNGVVAIKAGTKIYGELRSASQARRAAGRSSIDIRLTQIAAGGEPVLIATGSFQESGKSSGVKTAGAALVGAGVGAAVDGGEGAGKGAAIGAGVAILKKGDTVTVPPGALLEFQLTQPVTVNMPG